MSAASPLPDRGSRRRSATTPGREVATTALVCDELAVIYKEIASGDDGPHVCSQHPTGVDAVAAAVVERGAAEHPLAVGRDDGDIGVGPGR